MKKIIKSILLLAMTLCCLEAEAVYVEKMPVMQIQPNGDTLHFFVTGDECYHRYHDADGYTIVLALSGWWVYAEPNANGGIQPSSHPVGTINPATLGITPGLTITREEWEARRREWEIPPQYRIPVAKTSGRNHGDFCNLVIFVRFADDTAYSRPLSDVNRMFSDSTEGNVSVYNYFKSASYNKIFVRTYYAPEPSGDRILSYQSPHPRDYYMPYTEVNTIGYTSYSDRRNREFELLVGAVNYINDSFPVPTDYNLDCDNDGYIDNVNFVVKGPAAGWSDLLWPHKWNLYGHDVRINGKQVSTFNFALEGSGNQYFGTSTFCHEMFHSLGAPDLYRYNTRTDISPVGQWDLMATNSRPPQHMSAYMKYKYGNWIDSIPLITTPGTYTLHSVGDTFPDNIAYRFPSSEPDQYYVVEYRNTDNPNESQLPGKGLLIYRIDTRFNGNSEYDGASHFDEIWLFRPSSNSADENGMIGEAYFTPRRQRTEFSPSTKYYPYTSEGNPDCTFSISNISNPGTTISFYYTNRTAPAQLSHTRVTTNSVSLKWLGNGDEYCVYYRKVGTNEPYRIHMASAPYTTIIGLEPATQYQWYVKSIYHNGSESDTSSSSSEVEFLTPYCNNAMSDTINPGTSESRLGVPFANNENYNYSQQIYLASEMNGPITISSIRFEYAYSKALTKENCTIYMANTAIESFNDTVSALPLSQLTMVYTGDIVFVEGWNEILLDSQFYYNGVDNLVLAIDDNSGTPSRAGDRFYLHSTPAVRTLVYHTTSASSNPGPEQDTISGTLTRQSYRNNIIFNGCPDNGDKVYACVISENPDMGWVSGEGLFNLNEEIVIRAYPKTGYRFASWYDGVTDNPRTAILTQDTIFIALFRPPVGIDDVSDEGGYVIMIQHQSVTIQGVEGQVVNVYDLLGRRVAGIDSNHGSSVTFSVPHKGIYIVRIGRNNPVKLFIP